MREIPGKPSTYLDAACLLEERVGDIVCRMTLDEKIAQLGSIWTPELLDDMQFSAEKARALIGNGIGQISRIGGGTSLAPPAIAELANRIQRFLVEETRLGIPAMVHEECLSGSMTMGATCFPQIIGVASTWEPALVEEMTSVIRMQMRAVGAHQGLSPVLDIARDPRWGRVEETFGEDPYLTSRMAVRYIRGLQGGDLELGIVATGKHFVGVGLSEGGMNRGPVHLGPRELHEVFLRPFEAAIREAQMASVMASYCELDGVPVAGSGDLLSQLVREQWGFEGIVVSDYGAVDQLFNFHHVARDKGEAARLALEAGIDVELPSTECYGQPLREAIQNGTVDVSVIDRAVSRVLQMKFVLGLFENPYVDVERVPHVFDTPEQRTLAREIACKSIVLLKNENGLLPLRKDVPSIAIIGPNADSPRNLLGDYSYSAHVEFFMGECPESYARVISVLAGIRQRVSPKTRVRYAKGCGTTATSKEGFAEAVQAARASDVAVLVVGGKSGLTEDCTSGEGRDRIDIILPGVQAELVRSIYEAGTPVVVVLINGRPLSIPWMAEHIPAIVEAWLPGEEGGTAVADVLFGDHNPGGKLPVTLPRAVGQIPLFYNHKPSAARFKFMSEKIPLSAKPLFPFGHGLSYTRFEYHNLHVEPEDVGIDGEVGISVDIRNVGERDGDEVVQLYVRDVASSVTRPVKELRGFERVRLGPEEKRTVSFRLSMRDLRFYNRDMAFVVEPGRIEVMVGSSSDDIRIAGEFRIRA